VPPMKLTPNAAMRARDVSRPRAEHLAEAEAAEAAEASPPGNSRERTASGDAKGNTGRESSRRADRRGTGTGTEAGKTEAGAPEAGAPTGDERTGRPGFPRRRRGPGGVGRRGRSSR
jgi:hypothetical protein